MTTQQKLPIGFWVKKVDDLLTQRTNDAQQQFGLTRTSWQLLNVVQQTPAATLPKLIEALAPFASATDIMKLLVKLSAAGWVVELPGGSYTLTAAGEAVHQQSRAAQQQVRQQATQGITEADYLRALETLQHIAYNLE